MAETTFKDTRYAARAKEIEERVAKAAQSLATQGIRPTVARVRAALGGGSPNDLAPALKRWKESSESAQDSAGGGLRIPVAVADFAQELWQRATAAATMAVKSGRATELAEASVDEESLRAQIRHLREALEREAALYGELKVQAARHQAITRDALARLEESQARERTHLRALGAARGRISELEAQWAAARPAPAVKRRVMRQKKRISQKATRSRSPRKRITK